MNKVFKKWLIAGVALLIAGGIIFALGMSVLKWNFYKLDTNEYTEKSFVASVDLPDEEIRGVEIKVSSFPVTVKTGEEVALKYYESDKSNISVQVADGILKVTEKRKKVWFEWFGFGSLKCKYELTVPELTTLKFTGTNSDVTISDYTADSLEIKSTNTDLILNNCDFGTVTVDSTNADIELGGCTVQDFKIDSTNLDMEVKNCTFDSLTSDATNTDIEMDDTVVNYTDIKATNADLELKRITVVSVAVKATNLDADIYISGIKEEYTVEVSGHEMPPAQTGTTDKKITLSGRNNDVKLKWV